MKQKYKDHSFAIACIAIIAGVFAALGSAVHSASGLRADEIPSTAQHSTTR
jgi:hypothetical protein